MAEIIKNKNKIIFFNLLSTIVLQGLTFFAAPIFSSVLGTANYGIVSVYNTWVSIFSTVCSLQAASTIVKVERTNRIDWLDATTCVIARFGELLRYYYQ